CVYAIQFLTSEYSCGGMFSCVTTITSSGGPAGTGVCPGRAVGWVSPAGPGAGADVGAWPSAQFSHSTTGTGAAGSSLEIGSMSGAFTDSGDSCCSACPREGQYITVI